MKKRRTKIAGFALGTRGVLRVAVAPPDKNKIIFLHFPRANPQFRCANQKKMCRFAQHAPLRWEHAF
ncbi:MAG TPA: hypothetical protein VGP99_00135, partial [Tepidisphaeraceae bacterium]|nr:hypothetical protein [Tepidisphaeraceae bacterium]